MNNPLFTSTVQYPFTNAFEQTSAVTYADSQAQHYELYMPKPLPKHLSPEKDACQAPVVVLITGYPDPGFHQQLGMYLKDIAQYRSWAKLLASKGIAAVIYQNLDPINDAQQLIDYLTANEPRIDPKRMALWACSGNVPTAHHTLANNELLLGGVWLYGYLPSAVHTSVATGVDLAPLAEMFQFTLPTTNASANQAQLVIQAENDQMPQLNQSIDAYFTEPANHDVNLKRYTVKGAQHGFDVLEERHETRLAIEKILGFYNKLFSA